MHFIYVDNSLSIYKLLIVLLFIISCNKQVIKYGVDSSNQSTNPKSLKDLVLDLECSPGNNILHHFVVNNYYPNNSRIERYINSVLTSMFVAGVLPDEVNAERYAALHLAVLQNNILMVNRLM